MNELQQANAEHPAKNMPITNWALKDTVKKGNDAEKAVALIQKEIEKNPMQVSSAEVSTSLTSFLTGKSGIEKVAKESRVLFDKYESLVDSYSKGEIAVKEYLNNYLDVRNDIQNLYFTFLFDLKSIFGDSIRDIDPEVFDFTVSFLNINDMISEIGLDYQTLSNDCEFLLDSLQGNFNMAIDNALIYSLFSEDGLAGGLGNLFVDAISHYANAYDVTQKMKSQLESLKNSMRHDISEIQADSLRLLLILKNLNDLFIPQANSFFHNADAIIQDEYQKLINSLFATEKLRSLKRQRDECLENYKKNDQELRKLKEELYSVEQTLFTIRQDIVTKADDFEFVKKSRPKMILLLITELAGVWGLFLSVDNDMGFFVFVILVAMVVVGFKGIKKFINWNKQCGGFYKWYKQLGNDKIACTDVQMAYKNQISQTLYQRDSIRNELEDISYQITKLMALD